jgi:hypothetical protein
MMLELLYLAGCPNHDPTVNLVHVVLQAEGVPVEVQEILIRDYKDACAHRFPGSPTVRVNGEDVEDLPPDQFRVGFACRTYMVEGKPQGVPPRALVEQAIRAAQKREEQR